MNKFIANAFFCAVIPLAALADSSQAQAGASEQIDAAVRTVGSPSVSGPLAVDNAIQIQASSGASNVSVKVSSKRSEAANSFSVFSLTGQTPIGKGATDASLVTLDGLANGTTLELKYSDSHLVGALTPGAAVLDVCDTKYKPLYLKIPGNSSDSFVCDSATIKSLVSNKFLVANSLALPQSDYDDFKRKFYNANAYVWSWGLATRGGYQDFTFYDAMSLGKNKKRHSLWSTSLFGAYLPLEKLSAFTATFTVESAYKDAKSSSLCLQTPPATGTFLTCADGPIGEPSRTTTQILSLEWRRQITEKVAFSLQASRDFKNRISTIQLPLYFIGDAKSGLSGGLTLGWTSEDHKASLGVFVGQAFKLLD
jgi:hypothetical protein